MLPLEQARISPLDRSFLFGDGVYEVMPVYAGAPFRFDAHFDRLAHSLRELRIEDPHPRARWHSIVAALVAANGGGDLYVYLHVSRGAEAGRNHAPLPRIAPTVFAYCAPLPRPSADTLANGVRCITHSDTRWARCDIKSVALLANILLRQEALDEGASETLLLRDGLLTEASASSVHVVIDGVIHTPPQSPRILPGTTRGVVLELAATLGIPMRIAEITEQQLRLAQEIWLAAATREVQAVTVLDGVAVGNGAPGPLWRRAHAAFQQLTGRRSA